jgi:hypothetical protein
LYLVVAAALLWRIVILGIAAETASEADRRGRPNRNEIVTPCPGHSYESASRLFKSGYARRACLPPETDADAFEKEQ